MEFAQMAPYAAFSVLACEVVDLDERIRDSTRGLAEFDELCEVGQGLDE